jgi:hypothetical protein
MNNFNALLAHQGLLKHVNHAHRQCAPTPTGEFVATNAQKALASLNDSTLSEELRVFRMKVRHYEVLSKEVSNTLPLTRRQLLRRRWLNGQVASLKIDIERYEAEQDRRSDAEGVWRLFQMLQ